MRISWIPVALSACIAAACTQPTTTRPPITTTFEDGFERDDLGKDYLSTNTAAYELSNGSVRAREGYNRPLWLRRRLPDQVTIELEAWSQSNEGDVKVEIFGDGKSYDPDKGSYVSTGYVLIMGGWSNSKSMIARLDEHGKQLVERKGPSVEKGRRYRWKIERTGGRIDWYVDDMSTPYLSYDDPQPLKGADHGFFAFNNWEAEVGFDNLVITAK